MKIKRIDTLVCHARMRNWIFVKIVTDQPGLIGFEIESQPCRISVRNIWLRKFD